MQELNLMKNPLGSRGIGSISNVLMDNHLLRKLNLGWCELGSEGAAIIANFIGYNKGLQSLYLNNNFITDSVIS